MKTTVALGLDFGTESVRALLVDTRGNEHGSAIARYKHGQITETLPGRKSRLPDRFALQHPRDWLNSAARAVKQALKNGTCSPEEVVSIGVDFTSCTMLPVLADGAPLCEQERFASNPYAWPKLWKHHGAEDQARRMTDLARRRKEPWLKRYGGNIGLEWFFPKMLETLENSREVYNAAEVWLEGGDWVVWRLVEGESKDLPRSMCQAGYKALWNQETGFPSKQYLAALHPDWSDGVSSKMSGRLLSPGECAGILSPGMAKKLGLRPGIAVSAAVIDAHAAVPGAGAGNPGELVMVLGTSSCHMLNARNAQPVPGVAGIVEGGILPGWVGYETGQAAVGDAFDWVRRLAGQRNFSRLDEQAATLSPGAENLICLDWFNGCRTPLMDGRLAGAFAGLTLGHGAAHLYRAVLEATGYGLRWIVDLLREHRVPVERFIATGGLPHHNPLLIQIYSDILNETIQVPPSKQGSALGAAILGAMAAGKNVSGFDHVSDAIHAMAIPETVRCQTRHVKPDKTRAQIYGKLYREYRQFAEEQKSRKEKKIRS